jgi:hypothetical protein
MNFISIATKIFGLGDYFLVNVMPPIIRRLALLSMNWVYRLSKSRTSRDRKLLHRNNRLLH